ncbi:hypothetical protein B0H14DRAFT_2633721 [Mycena olivaceomarginata]|nr:hypothetical protein B0H14DRAFT_2633721 [Mycena olivaceomarginata]
MSIYDHPQNSLFHSFFHITTLAVSGYTSLAHYQKMLIHKYCLAFLTAEHTRLKATTDMTLPKILSAAHVAWNALGNTPQERKDVYIVANPGVNLLTTQTAYKRWKKQTQKVYNTESHLPERTQLRRLGVTDLYDFLQKYCFTRGVGVASGRVRVARGAAYASVNNNNNEDAGNDEP